MKVSPPKPFSQNGFVTLQDQSFLENQRKAGKIAAKTLILLEQLIRQKTDKCLLELNDIARDYIISNNGIPTFKNYRNFPGDICISINRCLVHGIPSNYKLQDGDVVKFDLGVTINNAIADTAISIIYGKPKCDWHIKLVESTREALNKGIDSIAINKKVGVIGNAIYKYVKGNGFNVVTNYGGHAISSDKLGNAILHAAPFIDNKSDIDIGIRMQEGMSICLEPLVVMGDNSTKLDKDGWGVLTSSINSHFEHTLFIHKDYVENITDRISYENSI